MQNPTRMFLNLSLVVGLALLSWADVFTSAGFAAEPDHGQEMLKKIPRLKQFIAAKEKQARADTAQAREEVSPEIWTFFKLAGNGQWNQATNLFRSLVQRSAQPAGPIREHPASQDATIRNAAWQPALEVMLVLEAFASGQSKYTEAFGRGIITSIPRGAIYFGGTERGRGLPTCFSESHADADPFFTLTQRALTDGLYLNYIRRMYGNKIYIPSTNPTPPSLPGVFSRCSAPARARSRSPQ